MPRAGAGVSLVAGEVAVGSLVAPPVEVCPVSAAGRSTPDLLEQLQRFLPPSFCGATPLLGGFAAAQAEAEAAVDLLRPQATLGCATDIWLTLQAHGYGVLRASGESDGSLRGRLRRVDDLVTRVALKSLVDELIAPDECQIIEWFETPYLDNDAWLDSMLVSGGPHSFLVVISDQGAGFDHVGAFVDSDFWLDSAFIGEAVEPAVYAAIINQVERARAAGTFWRLVIDS